MRIDLHAFNGRIHACKFHGFFQNDIKIRLILTVFACLTDITDQGVLDFDLLGKVTLFFGDITVVAHQIENRIAAFGAVIKVLIRIVAVRKVDDSCQHCGFMKHQLIGVLAKVVLRSTLHASDVSAEVQLIQIELEDFLFGEKLFKLGRKINLLDFIFNGFCPFGTGVTGVHRFNGEVRILYQLHCERGAALTEGTCLDIVNQRFGETRDIKSEVGEEPAVLDGKECIDEGFRTFVIDNVLTEINTDLGDQFTGIVIDLCGFFTDKVREIEIWGILGHFGSYDAADYEGKQFQEYTDHKEYRQDADCLAGAGASRIAGRRNNTAASASAGRRFPEAGCFLNRRLRCCFFNFRNLFQIYHAGCAVRSILRLLGDGFGFCEDFIV